MEKCEFEYLGPYQIQGVLGRGGMGTVYKGQHAKSGEPVAIKVIATGVANQMRFRRRFAAEVETLKRLRHPNIVQLIGYGEEQGLLFYSMEYVEGHSLHDHLRQYRKLDWSEVIQVGVEVAAALKHAHDLGIIHRDLKPANLMLTREGHIKLTDFGIAKLFGSTEQTAAGSLIGTADFMPPEQAEGKNVTIRSDLYSLGSVLFALLSGRAPFAGKSVPEVLYSVRYTPAPDSTLFAPDAPAELHALIAELLEKDPLKRPPTALVIGNRLKAMQQGLLKLEAEKARAARQDSDALATADSVKELTSIDLSDEPDEDLRVTANPDTRERPTVIASESAVARLVSAEPIAAPGRQSRKSDPIGSSLSVELAHTVDSVQSPTDLPSIDQPLPAAASHFTPVSEADAKQFTIGGDAKQAPDQWDWVQYASIAGIIILLLGTVGFGFWMAQPVSADRMYADISSAVDSGDESALVGSLGALEEFVTRYPDDPRAAEVRGWLDEAELLQATRALERRSARNGGEELTAMEQAFLACMQARNSNPREARAKLGAFLDVYKAQEKLSDKDRRYVELAEFAANSLDHSKRATAPAAALELEALIRSAERDLPKDKLGDFYRSLIELYGDKPWAQDQLARIRKLNQP